MSEELSFGAWLRNQRRALDLSRQAFADQVGCAEVTLRRIEAGTLKPSKELANILLEKLDIPQAERPQWISFARGLSNLPTQSILSSNKPITNLPTPLTSFIGREKELSEVITLLAKHRLVTLTGTGGVGKTRLSKKIGEQILGDYADGVWLVELAPLSDPALVPQTVVSTLGLIERSGSLIERASRSPEMMLNDFLQGKNSVLILDNCEHLTQACAGLAETLLQGCPDLHILATSREALGISGEAIYLVPSLSVPNLSQPVPDTLSHSEAARLFTERASLAQSHFAITHENALAVAQICHRLDGIPLAIELAAARLRTLSPAQISSRLDDRFRLLTGGSRTALPRHQTLRALVDWSYDLLSQSERVLLRRLAVFSGGCALEAAEQVCAGAGQDAISSEDVLDLLTHLVEKSLLAVEERPDHLRYRILETVRQYAKEKLMEAGEGEQICKRHLDYFLRLAVEEEPNLYGGRQVEWIERLEEEHSNYQTALAWSLENDAEAGQELVLALWWSWLLRGQFSEGYKWIQKALAARPDIADTTRAKLLSAAGNLAGYDDLKSGFLFSEQSVALFRQLNDEAGLAFSILSMGHHAYFRFDYEQATALFEESRQLFAKAGNQWGVGEALGGLGSTNEAQGNLEKAEALYQENLTLTREIGDLAGIAWTLFHLGKLAVNQAEYSKAMEFLSEGLSYAKMLRNNPTILNILDQMGIAASQMGNVVQARDFQEQALASYREMGHRGGILFALRRLGYYARVEGDYVRARALLVDSLNLALQSEDEIDAAVCLIPIGEMMMAQGQPEKFARLFGMANTILPDNFWQAAFSYFRNYAQQAVDTARAAMGEEAYAAAYEEGKKMTLDEAVVYALGES